MEKGKLMTRVVIYALFAALLVSSSRCLHWRKVAVMFQEVACEVFLKQVGAVRTLQREREVSKKKDESFRRIRREFRRLVSRGSVK